MEGHTMGAHNKRAVTRMAAPGGGGIKREKRGRKPLQSGSQQGGKAGWAAILFVLKVCAAETKLLSVFELHNLCGFQERSQVVCSVWTFFFLPL